MSWLRRHIPTRESIHRFRLLRPFAHHLSKPELWRLSRRSVPRAVALGLGIGAEVDLMAFFTSRYFGARNYAKIYGTIFGTFSLGVGIGPTLSGTSFDLFHSYTPIFLVYEVMLAVSCVIFLRLGPYRYPAQESAGDDAPVKVPA